MAAVQQFHALPHAIPGGAVFLGTVFLRYQQWFARVYFADLAGSGLCGLAVLAAMFVFVPENLIVAPLALWAAGRSAAHRRPIGAPPG
jgi:hypothetical protein